MEGAGLVNDGTNTMSFDDGPNEERDAGNWDNDSFSSEEMATDQKGQCQ